MASEPRTIDAVRFTCDIIEYLEAHGEAGITDIASEYDRSKSSVHAYLTTLLERQYVTKDDGQYSLGYKYLELAEHVKNKVGKYDVITSEIDKLAEQTGDIAQFGQLEQGELVYLYKARGESAVESMSSVGSREFPHCTALGKAILSQMDESEVRDALGDEPFPEKTPHTITTYDELLPELEAIRERGYAIDDQENINGLCCIAAPVVLDEGTILGAISVSGPSSRITENYIESELKDQVIHSANVVQINTKFS